MSAEDALFRVISSAAEALLEKRRLAGEPIDPTAIANETLRDFGRTIDLEEHAAALRSRLAALLEESQRAVVPNQPSHRRTT